MKKKLIIILAVIVVLALIAIGIGRYVIKNSDKPRLETKDSTPAAETTKKAKVILIGGQSNASGCTFDSYLKNNVTPEKYAEYEQGYDNVYISFFASGTNQSKEFVKCGARQGESAVCFGPELGLAEKLHELYPDQTFFIIKWAWGGTNLYNQWCSPSGSAGEGPMYRSFVDFVNDGLALIKEMGYEYEIEAMCWMQGEGDSIDLNNAQAYGETLTHLINDLRAEFAAHASADGIAFIDAYISDSPIWANYQVLNAEKDKVANSSPMNAVIDTLAEGLTYNTEPIEGADIAHYDSLSEIKLGHLFACEAAKFFD